MSTRTFDADATALAERATLGALLTHPDSAPLVTGWLRASDFTDPWRAAVYTVLREAHTTHHPTRVPQIAARLTERLGPRRADLPALADLLAVAPAHPDPISYARMVADTGSRRELIAQGVLLRAAALQATLAGNRHPVTSGCDLVDASVHAIARRWASATGMPTHPDATPIPLRAAARSTQIRLSADKLLRLHPPRDPSAEGDHEIALIGSLVAHPEAIAETAAWLPAVRIADPAWRTVYAAAIDLTELGHRVDPVTITWAIRAAAHHGAHVPTIPDLLAAADAGRFLPPASAARTVAADQLRRLAETGTTQLEAAAANPGVQLTDLLDTARLLTASLRHIATALPTPAPETTRARAPVHQLHATRGPVAG